MNLARDVLPVDAGEATLVGRVFDPGSGGPCVVAVRGESVFDLTPVEPTMSGLLEREDLLDVVKGVVTGGVTGAGGREWPLSAVLDGRLTPLAPCDLQVIKACGVTFVRSMIERVIEERAKGDPKLAADIRNRIEDAIGGMIGGLRPGSPESGRVKELLVAEGLWSQYLEVGIGPDAEVFTKAPVLAAVGTGAEIGVSAYSRWNNPEPELVLAVTSDGRAVGATLGNDVNLRDVEGRSALLLSKAKDNNASCAIGPFFRLFDDAFGIDDVRGLDIELTVTGTDGFVLKGTSSLREISRDVLDLVGQTVGPHHQYPDGFVLFTGTLFAPTTDRDVPGEGFTHKLGDRVRIASPRLGALTNVVAHAEEAPQWTFGIRALMANLASRGLLDRSGQA